MIHFGFLFIRKLGIIRMRCREASPYMERERGLSELLFNAVNEQGHLFAEACEQALREGTTGWQVVTSEYPVSSEVGHTRVDVVMRANNPADPELYALVECKRANPKYVHWLFGAPGLPHEAASCMCLGLKHPGGSSDEPPKISPLQTWLHFDVFTYSVRWWLEVKEKA